MTCETHVLPYVEHTEATNVQRVQAMTVTINESRSSDDEIVVELTPEEYEDAKKRALARVGLTYEELADQARRRAFDSSLAHSVWTVIGGSLDQ